MTLVAEQRALLSALDGNIGLLRMTHVRVEAPEQAVRDHRAQIVVSDLAKSSTQGFSDLTSREVLPAA
jgi:hypothetical protein